MINREAAENALIAMCAIEDAMNMFDSIGLNLDDGKSKAGGKLYKALDCMSKTVAEYLKINIEDDKAMQKIDEFARNHSADDTNAIDWFLP